MEMWRNWLGENGIYGAPYGVIHKLHKSLVFKLFYIFTWNTSWELQAVIRYLVNSFEQYNIQ